jgi:hypothetical protein
MIEPVTYRGATLHVAHLPSCWKIFIFMPGSHSALAETPCTEDIEGLQTAIVEARAIVDAALAERDKLAVDVAHLKPPAEEKPVMDL